MLNADAALAREGLGESQFRRGDIHCGTLYVYTVYVLCAPPHVLIRFFFYQVSGIKLVKNTTYLFM
jgi:hypothetical protein